MEANRGSIKLASIALPPLGYTPSDTSSDRGGKNSGHMTSASSSDASSSSACHSATSDNESIGSNGVVINGQECGVGVTDKKLVIGTTHTMVKRISFSSTNSLDSAGPDPVHPMSTEKKYEKIN